MANDTERACRMEYDSVHRDYVCTACGGQFSLDSYAEPWSEGSGALFDESFTYKKFKYCPRCGAKVEE